MYQADEVVMMKKLLIILLFYFLNYTSSSFVRTQFYDIPSTSSSSNFPEYEKVKNKPNIGFCFSGGGSRSYEASLGYLKGFHDEYFLRNVRYISSVSGGSWANAVFSYHNQEILNLDQLLCEYIIPEDITEQTLNQIPNNCARGYPVKKNLIEIVAEELLIKKTPPEDVWVKSIYQTFLKPAGISFQSLSSYDGNEISNIVSNNPHLMNILDFRSPCPTTKTCSKPFPIFNIAMLGPIEAAPFGLRRSYVMMEATASYVGFPRIQNVTYENSKVSISLGGVVDSIGFGSDIQDFDICGLVNCPNRKIQKIPIPKNFFSIANATAASSWAPEALVAENPLLQPLDNILLTVPYFSPYFGGKSRQVFVGDGADMENQGLISLLQRNVDRICMFINTATPLSDNSTYNPYTRLPKEGDDVDSSFAALFGMLKIMPSSGEDLGRDQVFRRLDFPRVIRALQRAQNLGKGAIAGLDVITVKNKWWGITGGKKVHVVFTYLSRVYEWERKLSGNVAKLIAPNRKKKDPKLLPADGMFKGFPHVSVSQLHLEAPIANALADMSAWVVKQNFNLFKRLLDEDRVEQEQKTAKS